MLQRNCILIAVIGGCIAVDHPANAQSLPSFTPQQLNRLGRDLAPTNSQDFFRQGRAQLEREIQILEQTRAATSRSLLKIDPATRPPERRSLNDDRRNQVK